MKTLVVYDSVYGNTRTIAHAIGDAIGDALPGDVEVRMAGAMDASGLEGYDLLIVGAPTHGGQPTEAPAGFLEQIKPSALQSVKVAAFDTRLTAGWVRIFGYAAPKIAARLEEKGGTLVGPPGDFYVKGRRGPLLEGEVERAAAWARELVAPE